jgi:integrase
MSIRKRAWTTTKGEKKEAWIADYTDQSGRRHIKTFTKKKDADSFHSRANVEVSEGTHTAASNSVSISEAGDLWIKSCEARNLERSTIDAYRAHLKWHIKPHLGRIRLSDLTAPLVRDFEDKLRAGEPAPGEESCDPRSPPMIRKILTSLGSLVADAQERGLVARNVVRDLRARRKKGVERRADRRQRGKLKVGVDIPTPQEIKAVVGVLDGRWKPILMAAIFTGLRSSELRGLRWSDIDFKKCELHVRQRVDQYKEFGAPKSESGERTVPLPPSLVAVLKEWKLACPKGKHDLVFPAGAGTPENHANVINRGMVPALIAAGVSVPVRDEAGKAVKDDEGKPVVTAKYTGLHALRHFYASWCINRRADGGLELPMKVVQQRLGHSSITMTADVYGHLFPRDDDGSELAAAEKALLG